MTQFSLKMENTVVVLLLLCAFSLAEEPRTQNNPHSDLLDLCTQLGDIRVQLAEDRVMIQQLQKDKQELEAKLKEQESQLGPMKEKLEEQDAKVKDLKNKLQVGQVAFSASLLASGSGRTGPFNAHTTLVFKHVVSNIGNAYSPNTGFFIAPVRGAYHFEFYVFVYGGSHSAGVWLVKNGEHIFMAFERQTNGGGMSANGATLLLEAGDVVFLRLRQNDVINDDSNHPSTFSGHMLFPM